MEQDKYIKALNKLRIKGMISEEELKEKIFEWNVKKSIHEIEDDGYVKNTVERIFKEKKK